MDAIYILIFILWIVLSGKITLEIVLFGLAATALVAVFMARVLGWGIRRELAFCRLLPQIAAYGLLLAVEIVKSSISVLPYAWGRKKPDGVIVEFDSGLRTETANAVLANSITMTPGTITVNVDGGHVTVHCLSGAFAEGIEDLSFARRLRKMESTLERRGGK